MEGTIRSTHDEDKRQHLRIPVGLRTHLAIGTAQRSAVIDNIAEKGLFVETTQLSTVGCRVSFAFKLLGLSCEAHGHIAWVCAEPPKQGLGIEFETTNQAMDGFIRGLVKLSPDLRTLYLADVLDPTLQVDEPS